VNGKSPSTGQLDYKRVGYLRLHHKRRRYFNELLGEQGDEQKDKMNISKITDAISN
jgi:hypothetical protein